MRHRDPDDPNTRQFIRDLRRKQMADSLVSIAFWLLMLVLALMWFVWEG